MEDIRNGLINKYTFILLLVLSLAGTGKTQPASWSEKFPDLEIKPVLSLQIWSSYTIGQEVFDETTQQYNSVDNRLNFQLRRSRVGFKGQVYKNLKFNLLAAFDLVGRDVLSGTEAGANNGSNPSLRLWSAYLQWKLIPDNERLNVTSGFMPVQIGRASISSGMRSSSMEKAWSQNYLRRHLVNTGPGRAMGVNMGGLFIRESRFINWGYDIGIFNPAFRDYENNSVGNQFSPLLSGRLAMYFGDPESSSYTIGHKSNYFGKRKGLTIALAGAHQGRTDLFRTNQVVGSDFLLNIGPLNIDGEWHYLIRNNTRFDSDRERTEFFESLAGTGYLRASYNLTLKSHFILEPAAMIVIYNGEMNSGGQENARLLGTIAGQERIADLGVNFYFNPELKLSLHYTYRDGDDGVASSQVPLNNYFFQPEVGAIRRGDWLGLGVVVIL